MQQNNVDLEIKEALKDWPQMLQKYAQADTRKAVIQILNSFLPFIGLWILMYFSLDWSIWITFALAIVNAFFLVRIFIIQHDCGHNSFLKNRKINNIIGWVCSLFSSIPYVYWARTHSFHHGHCGQLEVSDIGDIQTMTVKEFRKLGPWQRFNYRLFRMPVVLFVLGPIYYMLIPNRLPLNNIKGWAKARTSQIMNNVLLLVLYLSLGYLLGWAKFFIIQLSIIFIFAIIAVWFFYVQHQHEHNYKGWKNNWEYLLAAIKGSTYYKLPRIFQWLSGNIGFHHIHHLNSRIPNYNLEKAFHDNPILSKHVTTITFLESLKCMFHKLWDEDSQRMITFREFYRMERALA